MLFAKLDVILSVFELRIFRNILNMQVEKVAWSI